MKPLVSLIAAAIVLAALPIAAQWPNYSMAARRERPKGKLFSTLRRPKRPTAIRIFLEFGIFAVPADVAGQAAAKAVPAVRKADRRRAGLLRELPPGTPPNATFKNVGSGFKEGLPMLPWAADLVKQRRAENSKDNPDAHCLPIGFMQLHTHPQPRKIIQTPD